jgi:hypothetical protein
MAWERINSMGEGERSRIKSRASAKIDVAAKNGPPEKFREFG